MSWWFATYADDGSVIECVQTTINATAPVAGVRSVVFEAPDHATALEHASRLWYRFYCNETKRETRGRPRDRIHPKTGEPRLMCSTCAAYQKAAQERYAERVKAGTTDRHVRDEASRVQLNLARQRDRRREIRLETLVEVKKQFWATKTVREFEQWLEDEIRELTTPRKLLP